MLQSQYLMICTLQIPVLALFRNLIAVGVALNLRRTETNPYFWRRTCYEKMAKKWLKQAVGP